MIEWAKFGSPLSLKVFSDSANDERFDGSLPDARLREFKAALITVCRDDVPASIRITHAVQTDALVAPHRPIRRSEAWPTSLSLSSGIVQSVPPQ